MSAQDYTVDASAVGCCRGTHVWDSPDGAVPKDGRQVTCRVCPATARAKTERLGQGAAQGLLSRVLDESTVDSARYRVLLAAMWAAMDATPVAAPPEVFQRSVLQLFWDAVRSLPKSPPEVVLMALPHAVNDPGWAEPDCTCGKPASDHLLSEPAGKRIYVGDDDWWCMNYTPKETP